MVSEVINTDVNFSRTLITVSAIAGLIFSTLWRMKLQRDLKST